MKQFKSALPEIKLKYQPTEYRKTKISRSEDAFTVLSQLYDTDTIEYFETSIALFLNRANNTIGWIQLSSGGMSCTIIDPKILFATALKCGASSMILSHNHPSGNLQPSTSDINLTKKVVEIGKLMEIPLLDHLIVTNEGFKSMADDGLL
jgi:DNA repair protein RadC